METATTQWLYTIARVERHQSIESDVEAIEMALENNLFNVMATRLGGGSLGILSAAMALCVLAVVKLRSYLSRTSYRSTTDPSNSRRKPSPLPPIAPKNPLELIECLTSGSLPEWMVRQIDVTGTIFRLNTPLGSGPMLVIVGDTSIASDLLQSSSLTRLEKIASPFRSITRKFGFLGHADDVARKWHRDVQASCSRDDLMRLQKICEEKTEAWIRDRIQPFVEMSESYVTFDLADELVILALSLICEAALEYTISDSDLSILKSSFEILNDAEAQRAKRPHRYMEAADYLPDERKVKIARTNIYSVLTRALNAFKMKPTNLKAPRSFIRSVVRDNSYSDDEQRVKDIADFLYREHEVIVYSLAWALVELARHPKVTRDLRNALTGSDDKLARDMLKDVVCESMRMHPVSPFLACYKVGKDIFMEKKNFVIPSGSHVVLPSMVFARRNIEDPNSFIPSRWRNYSDKNFLQWSISCQTTALAEISWVISRICAEYEFDIIEEPRELFVSVLRCLGARVTVHLCTPDISQVRTF